MAFFNQTGGGGFEPKRQFRFLVVFPQMTDLTFMAKTASKPQYALDSTEHNVLNHVFKFPGIVKWEDVEVTLIDAVDPNTGSRFWNALKNSGYVPPKTPANLLSGVTKISSHATLGNVKIQQLDGGIVVPAGGELDPVVSNNVLDQWTLNNAFINKVEFGSLDYGSEDLVEISVGLTYDFAEYSGPAPYIP